MKGKNDMNKTVMPPTKNATERYIDFINENILPFVDYDSLHTSYRTDMVYAKGVLNLLHEAMIKVYGGEYLDRHDGDEGFVTIPGVIKGTKTGNICLALLDLDLSSSGEHWGTHFLCKYGVVEQGIFEGQDKRITELVGNFYQPYEYCYTASISVDHHVDEDALPRELKSILRTFRKYNAELTRPADISEQDTGKAEYEKAIKTAESKLMNKEELTNIDVLGDKSLIAQLFKEHEIAVPPKTLAWINSSLQSVFYSAEREDWSFYYSGRKSTGFIDYFERLLTAVQTKQQFEEMTQNGEDEPPTGNFVEEENEDDMEI